MYVTIFPEEIIVLQHLVFLWRFMFPTKLLKSHEALIYWIT